MPIERVNFLSPEEMIDVMGKASVKATTVHAYRFEKPKIKKEKSILDHTGYLSQAYIAIERTGSGSKGPIYRACCLVTKGGNSGGRANHNQMIDAFLANPDLVKRVSTAVFVFHKKDVIASYEHSSYAYSDFSIGTNWDLEHKDNIRKRVKESGLPFSETMGAVGEKFTDVAFVNNGVEEIVYRAMRSMW